MRTLLDFEIVLPVSGQAWLYWDEAGGSIDLRWGECVFIPPGFSNGWVQMSGVHLAVHFDLQAQPKLKSMQQLRYSPRYECRRPIQPKHLPSFEVSLGEMAFRIPLVTRLSDPSTWKKRLEPLVHWYTRRAPRTLEAQLLHVEILSWALRTLAQDAAAQAGSSRHGGDPRILELLREMDDVAVKPSVTTLPLRPSVQELAAHARMGLTAFREAFQQTTGRTPRDFLEERRIERAGRNLLEGTRGIAEIARAEGYEDPYHFSRVFKRVYGKSPRAYRKQRT
jgi:AraC-like DNA-binding protein